MKPVRPCCSECGRSLPKPKIAPNVDTANMTDAELFRHYKQTAPIEDLRFYLRNPQTPELVARIMALITVGKPTRKDLASVAQQWRGDMERKRLAAGEPFLMTTEQYENLTAEPENVSAVA